VKNDPILIYYGLFFISIGLIESGYQGISAVGLFLLWITLAALIGFFHCYFFYLSTVAEIVSDKHSRDSEEVAWDERGWSRSGEELEVACSSSPYPSPLAVEVLALADAAWVGLPEEDLVWHLADPPRLEVERIRNLLRRP